MQYLCRIDAIRKRAARLHLPLGDLCRNNGVDPSTFYRWGQPDANPRMRSMLQALEGMERELSAQEAALVAELQRGAP